MRISRDLVARVGLFLGPVLGLTAALLLPERTADGTSGLTPGGLATAGVAVWMATWWLSEAVPLAVTALLPVVLFPLLGIADIRATTTPYAHPLIFLFLGGFLLGLGIQRFGLHRRVALLILLQVGSGPRALIGGFMLSAALLSMWISNTATTIMMLPIAVSLLKVLREHAEEPGQGPEIQRDVNVFGTALVLGIAYAASIGGMGTLVGTAPNLVLAAFVKDRFDTDVTMVRWLGVGLPLVVLLLPLVWWYLTHVAFRVAASSFPFGREVLEAEKADLGPMGRGERVALVVFLCTAAAWVLRPQLVQWFGLDGLTDSGVAMIGGLSLFVIPVDWKRREFAMDWETALKLPWGILILFGGGLSLAAAIGANDVDVFLASGLQGLKGVPTWVLALSIAAMVVFLTEITSNTAVTTTMMPVLAATAVATEVPPGVLLTAAALAATCAFMLPVATPPNAIVYSSGQVSVSQMARAGFGLNLIAIAAVTLTVSLGARLFLG